MPPSLRTALVALALASVGACTCDPDGFKPFTYACSADADCIEGYRCSGGVCALAGQDGGGAGGGGGATEDAGPTSLCVLAAGTPCYLNGLASPQLRYGWNGVGGCAAGGIVCGPTGDVCADQHVPGQEYCDGVDTTCTGVPDPLSCGCNDGFPCYQGRPFTIGAAGGRSRCRAGVWNCSVDAGVDHCVGELLPIHELCNGVDDDCDGVVDNNPTPTACGPGVCAAASRVCGADGGEQPCDLAALADAGRLPGYSPSPVEACDGLDNDCDGLVDEGCLCLPDAGATECWDGPSSACPADGGSCQGLCRRGTHTCTDGGTGYGSCQGEVLPSVEDTDALCGDGVDNDCNGPIDCQDVGCDLHRCGASGLSCSGGACLCTGNGGVAEAFGQERTCDDGKDNDCNGLTDCEEPWCTSNGQGCGANGRVCATDGGAPVCACSGNGGRVEPSDGGTGEGTCDDGADNDCNGLVDCADTTACSGRRCAGGGTCDGGVCVPPRDAGTGCVKTVGQETRETSCNDGLDNDCDGQADCGDPDCNQRACDPSAPTSVCCGATDAGVGRCRNLATDPANCGLCGLGCGSGTCVPVGTNPASGACTCNTGFQCPRPSGSGYVRQACQLDAGVCSCQGSTTECGPFSAPDGGRATRCSSQNYCYYR